MANTNAPAGLAWLGDLSAGLVNGVVNEYEIPASETNNVFIGDPVKSNGTSNSTTGVPQVIRADAGDTLRGAVVAFKIDPTNLNISYGTGSTVRTVYVADHPYAEFLVQSNGTLAATDIGANMDLVAGSGSTYTNLSGYQLDESSVNTTSAQMRLIRLQPVTGNAFGSYGKAICMINEHELKSTTGE